MQQPTATATLLSPPPFTTSFLLSWKTPAIPKGLERQGASQQREFLVPPPDSTVRFHFFSPFCALIQKKEKDTKKKKRFKLFIGSMSLCWYIFVVFCMGLVSVYVKAPHGCLFMPGAVLCWQSLPSWHRLTRQTPGGKPTTHHSLTSVSTNAEVAALRLW